MKEIAVDDGVGIFLRDGHYFIPAMEKDVGEVTVFYAGKEVYYARCSTESFLNRLVDRACMDIRLLREFSFGLLGQKKMAPIVLSKDLVLLTFIHLSSKNRHHRKGYIRLSSILSLGPCLLPNTCKVELPKAHILYLRLSARRLVENICKARMIRDYYADQFSSMVSEKGEPYEKNEISQPRIDT